MGIVMIPSFAQACDICGCGIGNNYIGLLPEFQKRMLGVRYRHNRMYTHLGINQAHTHLTTIEKYQNVELWGGWQFYNKWRLLVNVPYNIIQKENAVTLKQENGLGDVQMNIYRNLLEKKLTSKQAKIWSHSMWIGAGLKLPTGKYNAIVSNENLNATNTYQLGTGSIDAIFAVMYDIRKMDMGWNTQVQYKYNTINKDNYSYGNKWSISTQLYHKFFIKKRLRLVPSLGTLYENSTLDKKYGYDVFASGGTMISGQLGLEVNVKRWALGFNYQHPLYQNLAHSIIAAKDKFMIHCSIAF
jgi:hypothetical protein